MPRKLPSCHSETRVRSMLERFVVIISPVEMQRSAPKNALSSTALQPGTSFLAGLPSQTRLDYHHRGKKVLTELLSRWPLIQQIRNGSDGTGRESFSHRTQI